MADSYTTSQNFGAEKKRPEPKPEPQLSNEAEVFDFPELDEKEDVNADGSDDGGKD